MSITDTCHDKIAGSHTLAGTGSRVHAPWHSNPYTPPQAGAKLAGVVVPTDSKDQADFDHEISAWGLPPGLELVVGDVRGGGSSTPSMVAAITRFRKVLFFFFVTFEPRVE